MRLIINILILLLVAEPAFGKLYQVKIVSSEVIDGDTIRNVQFDVGFGVFVHHTVRLHGIDAPEVRGKDKVEKKRGFIAKDRLKQLVTGCRDLLVREKGYDSFRRVLGVILCDGQNVNNVLLREGHAKVYVK